MRILMSAVAIASLAGALQAGNWTGDWTGDWTGAHGGMSAAQHSSEAGIGGGQAEYGLHGGYHIDDGGLVLRQVSGTFTGAGAAVKADSFNVRVSFRF